MIEIDAASHGGVDDARDLRERSFYAPIQSRFKIYIIDEAHMVTTAGFNALLKLVEEPPPHLKFIFATTEPDKVIGTIKSRTHHYPFRLVPPGTLRDNLARICAAENVTIEPAALGLVVRAGAGSVRDAQSVLDQLVAGASSDGVTYRDAVALLGYTDVSLLDDVVDAFGAHDGGAVLEIVDRVMEAGHDPRRFAEDLLERLRDLIVLNAVPDAGEKGLLDVPVDVLERMTRQATLLGRVELTRAADIVNTGSDRDAWGDRASAAARTGVCARLVARGQRRRSESVGAARATRAAVRDSPETIRLLRRPLLRRAVRPSVVPTAAAAPVLPAGARSCAAPPGTLRLRAPAVRSRGRGHVLTPEPAAVRTGVGDLDATAVRSLWDSILDVVKGLPRGRTTQPLIAMHAQVLDVRDNVLVLGFTTGPLERLFRTGGGEEVLLQAIKQLLGVDWKISTTLAGAAAAEAATPRSGGAAAPPSESMAADRAPLRSSSARNRPAKAPRSAAAEAAAASVAAEPDVEIVLDEARPDDADADDGASGLALLQRHLGATVINDGESA